MSRQWISQYFRVATDAVLSEHVQTHQLTVTKAYDIQLARDDTARDAALEAALQGASRALVRRIAKQGPEAASQEAAAGESDAAGNEAGVGANSARYVASAVPDARVGNLAEAADELGLTMRFEELELTHLIRDAIQNGTDEFSVGAFLRLVRNDMRRLEGLVRAKRPVGATRAAARSTASH